MSLLVLWSLEEGVWEQKGSLCPQGQLAEMTASSLGGWARPPGGGLTVSDTVYTTYQVM